MLRKIILFLSFFPFIIKGQDIYYLHFNTQNDVFSPSKKNISFDSKEKLENYLEKIRSNEIKKGFVLASIDSLRWKNDTAFVSFYQGERFREITISYPEDFSYIIRKTPKINEKLLANHPFQPEMVEQLIYSISNYLNKNGFPFSKVFLEVKNISPIGSEAELIIEQGPFIQISKIILNEEANVGAKYIQNAISIKEGDAYNSKLIQNISSKVEQIQFVKEIRPHEILFTPEGTELYLYLETNPISSINGILGLQPNPVTQKTVVTGDIRLKLLNIIKRGEELQINWKSLQPKTQELKLNFNFPFLFNSPFGVDADFNLYKLDSTYLKTDLQLGVRYYFSGGSYFKAFYHSENANLLSGAGSSSPGNLGSVSGNNYGLGVVRNKVDYLPNPSKGLLLSLDVSTGKRKSKAIDSDSISSALIMRTNFQLEAFLPITYRHVIRLANHTSSYYAPRIFQNELFRFGGLNIQRGFDEESLYASTLTTFTVEYRFLVDKNSHAFAFYDQTFYENNAQKYTFDSPFGAGLGYSFGTKLGIFSISYAIGKQFDNPVQVKNGKVHFGYTAYF